MNNNLMSIRNQVLQMHFNNDNNERIHTITGAQIGDIVAIIDDYAKNTVKQGEYNES